MTRIPTISHNSAQVASVSRFWLEPDRHPRTVLLFVWQQFIEQARIIAQRYDFPEPVEMPSKQARDFRGFLRDGPRIANLGDKGRLPVFEKYLLFCEEREIADIEINRLALPISRAVRTVGNHDDLRQMIKLTSGLNKNPGDTTQAQAIPARLLEHPLPAPDFVLACWIEGLENIIHGPYANLSTGISQLLFLGPLVSRRWPRVNGWTQASNLEERFVDFQKRVDEIGAVLSHAMSAIGGHPTAFSLAQGRARLLSDIAENPWLKTALGAINPEPLPEYPFAPREDRNPSAPTVGP